MGVSYQPLNMSYKGIVWSKQALENRAKSLRGLKRTPEQCKRIGLAKLGAKLSAEAIAKRTETRRKNGWNKNPEQTSLRHSVNNARAMLGKPVSDETRLKRADSMRGEKNHNWKGGLTPLNDRIRKSCEYQIWRIAVLKRDNYTCRICGKRGGKLHADHIKPFALFPELRFEQKNGRTLCIPCHCKTDTHGWRKIYHKKQ